MRSGKYVALSNLSNKKYKRYKKVKQQGKFKKSALTLNDKFELHNVSFSVSDIQNYFEYIIKKH